MEKQQTAQERYESNNCENIFDCFQTVCDVEGHLFDIEPERDILPKQTKDNLKKYCFVCESLIQFWHYSSDMVDEIRKVKC